MFAGRSKIGTRMVLSFILVVITAMSIPAWYSLKYLSQRIYREARLKMESDLEIANLLFNMKKQNLLRSGRTISRDFFFSTMVANRLGESIRSRMTNYLHTMNDSELTFLTITDANGIVLFRSRDIYSTGDDISTKPYTAAALNGHENASFELLTTDDMLKNGLLSPPYTNSRPHKGIAIITAIPVYLIEPSDQSVTFRPQPGSRKVVGTIILAYLLNDDLSLIKDIQSKTRALSSVYTPGGHLLTTSDRYWRTPLPPKNYNDIESRILPDHIAEYRNRNEIAGYFGLQNFIGQNVALFELRASTASISRFRKIAMLQILPFFALGIIIASILGYLLTRRILDPILKLRRGAEEIGRGNLLYHIDMRTNDEFSQLAGSFNDMSVKLHRYLEEMRISKQQVEEYSTRLKSAHSSLEMYSRELEKVNQQLLDSNIDLQKANTVKDTFISTVSHELRTPLTSIIGYITILLEGVFGPLTEEQRDSLEVVLRRGKDLQALISDLLNVSRIDAGRLEIRKKNYDLSKELRSLEEVFREKLLESSLALTIETPDDFPRVYADRDRINQVLFNLVGNAIKFTPPGGKITIRAARRNDAIGISVSDTGIGIAPEELDKIFERFYQIDNHDGREYGGTGLGLAIVRDIIELHGGSIKAKSARGEGTTFTFVIPNS